MSGREVSAYRERNSTADRALEILALFSDEMPVVSGSEVAARLGVARSTAYRYLQSLVASRFLEEAPGGGFRLGVRVLELARLARRAYGLPEVAAAAMIELAAAVNETVLLTRRVGDIVVCLDRIEPPNHRVRISYERGSTFPINAGASALILLAWEPEMDARALLEAASLQRFTPATLTDVNALLARLKQIRSDGYSVTRSEFDADVVGIAAPIRQGDDRVVGAVSVVALASRVSKKQEHGMIDQVRSAARTIGERFSLVQG